MLSNGQPIEQAPHSMQLPKLTRFFCCSSSHSYTPAGQKWLQYLPLHFVPHTAWSTTSMCAWPVSSTYLTVKSLSLIFSISAGPEPLPHAAHEADRVQVVVDPDVLVGRVDPVLRPAHADGHHGGDAEVGHHGVHGSGRLHEGPNHRLAMQLADALDHDLA